MDKLYHQYIIKISQIHLKYVLNISWIYLKNILNISEIYFKYISNLSKIYQQYILTISCIKPILYSSFFSRPSPQIFFTQRYDLMMIRYSFSFLIYLYVLEMINV